MPGWDLAASVYAAEVQPDFDADWADDVPFVAVTHTPALAFEKQSANAPQFRTADPERAQTGGPHFGRSSTVEPPVAPPGKKPDSSNSARPGKRQPFWTPADSPPAPKVDAQIPWFKIFETFVLAFLVAGAILAYPRAHTWYEARSVPSDLRGYLQGKGVPYAAPGQGYSVRLPAQPVRSDLSAAADAPWLAVHRTVVTRPDYQIVIRVGDLAHGHTVLPFGVVSALADRRLSGELRPFNVRSVTFDGLPAYVFDATGARPMRGEVFQRGARVYVVTAASASASKVLTAVMHSFRPAAA